MRKAKFLKFAAGFAAVALLGAVPGHTAELTVGYIGSMSGPVSSLGLPYTKGLDAALAYQDEIAGGKVRVVRLDDASDPTTAARNARKLIGEEKVDVLIGPSGVNGTVAVAAVARELKTPLIALAPASLEGSQGEWMVTMSQPFDLLIESAVAHMRDSGVKTVAFIGFADALGDMVHASLVRSAEQAGIQVVANERYARTDASVMGQTLRILGKRPDAVFAGTSGTPGALPFLALADRGYQGRLYGTHGLINTEFLRVAGKSAEGLIVPSGPVLVAEQLPADNPVKPLALEFIEAYRQANGEAPRETLSAYTFDAWRVLENAAARAQGTPGTPEYRESLLQAIQSTTELAGAHGVYNFTPASRHGSDQRSVVMVQIEGGQWKLLP